MTTDTQPPRLVRLCISTKTRITFVPPVPFPLWLAIRCRTFRGRLLRKKVVSGPEGTITVTLLLTLVATRFRT
jgi:hypothetical protein